MNDELTFKADDVIVITQASEDETWLEGTLNGRTGWFPSNYVELIIENIEEHKDSAEFINIPKNFEHQSQTDATFRIKVNLVVNELNGWRISILVVLFKIE